ncbi:TIGR03364 family FAD-dependent oxidoreductase [Actinokineospora globicatena]|uniref:TIGR03364 family FAD-dependent oxidoreductase n=1 Tax=Actinokineospora globicatena TaxID=103729 RepID=UPI0020A2786F|nr:TIGR03364 family FAD-dependent oxidoreductase [Actinokineospora globicatena]MCP2300942.1 FAD dependent oxidoreductase TIGR03364 [Actinokineospora globicatena]GLW77428.1 oxidase [Actinokineospora globicatena]GLW84262.1 oxidase [Actinokineospora globicatena]
MTTHADLVVVGAGIVGLAHAAEAVDRGLRVVVLDRDDRAVGASVRNFGHICLTAQHGDALTYGLKARQRWLSLAAKAGFWVSEAGTVVAARAADEVAVLAEFAQERGDQVRLLDADGVRAHLPVISDEVIGGAWLPLDLRVDPREAVPALATWLAAQGVDFRWRTTATGVESGAVHTTRGTVTANNVVVAVGHDIDRLLPDVAEAAGVQRCLLRMMQVSTPDSTTIAPAVLSGLSMLRYAGLNACPSAAAVRERITRTDPALLDVVMNLMFTQRPDGDLVIGDTHRYGHTHDPFDDEPTGELVLRETARLLGVDRLTVRARWRGVYAAAERSEFLLAHPLPGVHVVSVTSGIGMTTAFGLAPTVLDRLGAP